MGNAKPASEQRQFIRGQSSSGNREKIPPTMASEIRENELCKKMCHNFSQQSFNINNFRGNLGYRAGCYYTQPSNLSSYIRPTNV